MAVQDPLERLRIELHAAAEREVTPRVRSRRRWRRGGLALAGALLVSGGVATGVDLIHEGSPDLSGNKAYGKYFGTDATKGTLWVRPIEKGQPLPFGVLAYRRHGKRCAQVGYVRGTQLGSYSRKTFHVFVNQGASCVSGADHGTLNFIVLGDRLVGFGRAAVGTRTVTATAKETGETNTAPVAANGAFLVTLDGDVKPDLEHLSLTFTPPAE